MERLLTIIDYARWCIDVDDVLFLGGANFLR